MGWAGIILARMAFILGLHMLLEPRWVPYELQCWAICQIPGVILIYDKADHQRCWAQAVNFHAGNFEITSIFNQRIIQLTHNSVDMDTIKSNQLTTSAAFDQIFVNWHFLWLGSAICKNPFIIVLRQVSDVKRSMQRRWFWLWLCSQGKYRRRITEGRGTACHQGSPYAGKRHDARNGSESQIQNSHIVIPTFLIFCK